MKKFSKLAGATATVMAAAMVLSSTAMADETFKIDLRLQNTAHLHLSA